MAKKRPLPKVSLHSIPPNFLSSRLALLLLFFIITIGIIGYKWIEGYGWIDAIYMVVITISTVGFTEAQPLSETGRLFTAIYIMLTVGIFAYILSVFSYYVIQGEIFKKMHTNYIQKGIEQLNGHVILCGYGRYGREVAQQYFKQKIEFVIIERSDERLQLIRESPEAILYVGGDATHDETLMKAGVEKAGALISALPDDSDNVFTVLSARQLNPTLNIISRANDPRSEKKLQLAGADHVIMPDQIGGFYMANLVSKPGAIDFFSFLTNEYQSDIGFEEVSFEDLPAKFHGLSIRQLRIRELTGTNVIGFKQDDGSYIINPGPDTTLAPGNSLIIIGDRSQLKVMIDYLLKGNEVDH